MSLQVFDDLHANVLKSLDINEEQDSKTKVLVKGIDRSNAPWKRSEEKNTKREIPYVEKGT